MRKILLTLAILGILLAMSNCDKEPMETMSSEIEPEKIYRVIYDGNGNTEGEVPVDNNLYATGDKFYPIWEASLRKNGATLLGWHYEGDDITFIDAFTDHHNPKPVIRPNTKIIIGTSDIILTAIY